MQVSTEFAPVIAAREYFYEKFGQILWILPSFNPDSLSINQSIVDILTANNDHLFVLDPEMQSLSKNKGMLYLKAFIHWPFILNNQLTRKWKNLVCTLNDIEFINGHAQLLDVKAEEEKVNQLIVKNSLTKKSEAATTISTENRLEETIIHSSPTKELDLWWLRWNYFIEQLVSPLNRQYFIEKLAMNFRNSKSAMLWLEFHKVDIEEIDCTEFVIRALYCASVGELSYGYTGWSYIANQLVQYHPQWFLAFVKTLQANHRHDILSPDNQKRICP